MRSFRKDGTGCYFYADFYSGGELLAVVNVATMKSSWEPPVSGKESLKELPRNSSQSISRLVKVSASP